MTTVNAEIVLAQVAATKLRVFSLDFAARFGWQDKPNARELARRTLRKLERSGYVTLTRRLITPPPCIHSPVLYWRPGDPTPDFPRITYRLRSRACPPLCEELLVTATPRAAAVFGGAPGRIKSHQLTHDLLVGEAFLNSPVDVQRDWLGEDCYARDRRGLKLPDALAIDPRIKTPYLAIEAVNKYTKRHLHSFHFEYAVAERMEYMLW
jgi:hypothetical protein